jgi:hypothetical protein
MNVRDSRFVGMKILFFRTYEFTLALESFVGDANHFNAATPKGVVDSAGHSCDLPALLAMSKAAR